MNTLKLQTANISPDEFSPRFKNTPQWFTDTALKSSSAVLQCIELHCKSRGLNPLLVLGCHRNPNMFHNSDYIWNDLGVRMDLFAFRNWMNEYPTVKSQADHDIINEFGLVVCSDKLYLVNITLRPVKNMNFKGRRVIYDIHSQEDIMLCELPSIISKVSKISKLSVALGDQIPIGAFYAVNNK